MTKFIISVSDLDASFVTMTAVERRIQIRRSELLFTRLGMDMRPHTPRELHECSSVEVEGFKRGYHTGVVGQYDMGGLTDPDGNFWDKDEVPQFLAKGTMDDDFKFPEDPGAWLSNETPTEWDEERFLALFTVPCHPSEPRNGVVPKDEWDDVSNLDHPFDPDAFGADAAAEWLASVERKSADAMYNLELDGGVSEFASLYL